MEKKMENGIDMETNCGYIGMIQRIKGSWFPNPVIRTVSESYESLRVEISGVGKPMFLEEPKCSLYNIY